MNPIASKSRLLLETLVIIAGCEIAIMLLLPLVLPGANFWLAASADTTLLVFTAGPLLYWRFGRHHRSQDAQRRAELEQRTLELLKTNATLKHEVGERERAQSFLNSVVENLPIPVFIKEAKELRFVLWNKAGEKLSGIPNAEMIGRNDFDFFPVQDAERNVAKDRAAFETKGGLEIPEEIMQTREQGARIVHVWKVPIFDAAGQPAFLLGIAEDITERKLTAAALRESEERFRTAMQFSAIGMALVAPDGRWLDMNQSLCRIVGYSREELLATNFQAITHPDDLNTDLDQVRRILEREIETYQMEKRYLHKNGGIVWVLLNVSLVWRSDGSPRHFIAQIEDISDRKRAADALHQSEERFRLLVEESPDVIGIYQDNRLVFINSIGVRLLGARTQAELLNRKSEQLIHPDDLADASDRIRRRLAGETGLYPAEVRYLRTDGTPIPMEVSAAPITYNGQPAVQFIARDITERKRAQQQLAENERHLRLILESVPECVKLVAADGTLLSMNPSGLAMVEADRPEEVVGRCVYELLLPQYRPMFEALNAAVFRGESQTAEYETVGLKGTHRWMETSAVPLRDGEGRIIAQLAVTRDITQRRQAEELMRLQEAALRSAANVIVITDRTGAIVWTNPAFTKVTGYTAAEALGQNPRVLKQKDQPATNTSTFYQNLWQTISRGDVWQGEFHNSRKDGTLLIEEASITPVRNTKGEISHFVAVKQDITARTRAATELENVHRQLLETSRLAGMAEVATNVLHNVGNVLNSVNISAALVVDSVRKSKISSLARIVGLLQEHAPDLGGFVTSDPKGKQLPAYLAQLSEHLLADQKATLQELDSLRRNIEHIKEIVAMQQNYATVAGVKEVINVVDLMEDSLRINAEALSRHRVAIDRDFEMVPLLNIEKHKVLQILVNLLRNAKHACQDSDRADRRLTVRIANGDGRVKISVADNGVGIPPENLTRIFNYGFTTRKDGHGFGLHSGALAAQEMGGSLIAQSAGPGQGATFTLELPLADAGGRA